MGWIRAIAREIWGLFVDDIALAIASLVLIALIALFRGALFPGALGVAAGPVLFGGLAAILVVSALRRAGKRG